MLFARPRAGTFPITGWLSAAAPYVRAVASTVALCAVSLHAVAQTPGNDLDQVIDDDLQAQAQIEMDSGHRERALLLLNELVQRDPRQAGALLDAALLYCQLGERNLSLQALTRIEARYKVPPAIEKLIGLYKASSCSAARSRPELSVSVGAGATSNANFGPSNPLVTFAPSAPFAALELAPASLAHSDQYLESAVQGELPIAALQGVTLLAGLTDRQYRTLHDFDERTATFGAAYQKALDHGELDSQVTANLLWLGSDLYQRNLEWRTAYWTQSTAWHATLARAGLDFAATDETYPGNALYDAVHFELRAALQAHLGERTTMLMFVGPALDQPYNNRPGGTRHGYTAWFALDYDMDRHGLLEAILQQRTLNDATPYDPVFFGDVNQRQTVRAASLRYSYPINRAWSLYGQVSAERVSDSISLFSYTVRDGSIGLSWKY
jgi:outer membrane scaffolding protein for murein synthesis (MipA/OmpV family)